MKKKSDKKVNESRLRESEVRYRRLFESAHDGILILDSKTGQVTDVNHFLINLLGFTKSEFLDKKLWELGAFKNMKAARETFQILQRDGYVRYEDLPLETRDGNLVDVEFVSNSYMAGSKLVIQCNIRDITERKRIEVIKESKKLLDTEKQKLSSIADATHELRTPLAIIKGNADLAIRGYRKKGVSPISALNAINYEIEHLTGILSDLALITSRAWELKNRIYYENIKLKTLLRDTLKRSKVIAGDKHISLVVRDIPDITILGDRMYLEKMLLNLIRNSIIYGNKNGTTVVSVKKNTESVSIDIADDGIGISEEDLPHVFERFYRADKYHSSGGNIVGLGLSIVKWIAEIHGGNVTVQSVLKKGSVFSVMLPIKKTE